MTKDLSTRLQAAFDKFKDLPEARFTDEGVLLKRDAYVAWLDARQMIEKEVLPALHRLGV